MNNNYIPTKKKITKYTFLTPPKNNDNNIKDNISFFYQICTFPHPAFKNSKKFHMRKFVINDKNEFISINDYYLSKKQCKKFFEIKKPHEYKCYHVYSLDDINYPSLAEISTLKSDILSHDYNYSGYAPFNRNE